MTMDSEDPNDEVQYHLQVGPEDVAEAVLLPGDPDRVPKITDTWDDSETVAEHREFRTATGTVDGTPISVSSTGIGSPSAAIAVEELARLGVDTLLRVGSCGSLVEEAAVGDLIITTGAVRQEGTSKEYVREDYPAVADYRVVSALIAAAERLDYDYHVGLTCSTDSFYAGQGRPGFEGFEARGSDELVGELRDANVLNFEMEASSILTLANLYGLRAGAVCTVYANRVTGEFQTEGERKAAKTASTAVSILASMESDADAADADAWHADL
ncbi:nucleoside phosphorylase [Halorhabdus sp. BNX81]|uniref:nucleoside phosphorylase n=1 Tax=Halorhabdus sp. BNX81 TaxID=2980181 RepID=UPI0023DD101C|nr:nucleoside phosphorylase [Halorhabdus sp. BNX81]